MLREAVSQTKYLSLAESKNIWPLPHFVLATPLTMGDFILQKCHGSFTGVGQYQAALYHTIRVYTCEKQFLGTDCIKIHM